MKHFVPIMPVRQHSTCNRRRPRRALYWAGVAVILLLVALTSCSPKAYPVATPLPKPSESAAVSPGAQQVRTQIVTVRESGHAVTAGLAAAVAEADRLRQQASASKAELDAMWQTLTQEQARFAAMMTQLSESQATAEQLVIDAAARDEEIKQLRQHHDLLTQQLAEAAAYRAMAEPKVAIYDWCQRNTRWLLVSLALSGGAYVVVRYVLPLILKFFKPL